MLFTGHYEHLIDAKNRLAIPADIRARWSAIECGEAWYALPWPTRVIRLYTEADFTARAAHYRSSLTPDPNMAELQVRLFGMASRLEMDSAGRIRLPERMLSYTRLTREVVLVGAGEWLEVRDRGPWLADMDTMLDQLPELMARTEPRPEPRDHPPVNGAL